MQVTYKALVLSDPFGSVVAVFDDVPDAIGQADDAEGALAEATQSLRLALLARLSAGQPLPPARASDGIDVTITLEDRSGKSLSARA